jgi:histidinol dehydrogenase
MKRYKVTVTTDGSGNATAYSPRVSGELHSVIYVPDGSNPYASTVDMTITSEATGESLVTRTDVSAGFATYPRQGTASAAGVASLYAAGGTAVQARAALANDRIKIVLAQGGATKVGAFHFLIA